MRPDVRIINLETSITRSEKYAPKGINYRMDPDNADCLKAGAIDCCVLGNNHVLDWERSGLLDTLALLSVSTSRAWVPATLSLKPARPRCSPFLEMSASSCSLMPR